MAEIVAVFVMGAVFGGLIVTAWKHDPPGYSHEPTDAGREIQDADIDSRSRRVQ